MTPGNVRRNPTFDGLVIRALFATERMNELIHLLA